MVQKNVLRKVQILEAVDYAVVDYESASDIIIDRAKQRESYGVYAMPVHGLMLAVNNGMLSSSVKKVDLIVPDGHPIRWLMNYFYNTKLNDRVYGPELTRYVLKKANDNDLSIFLYGGNTEYTLNQFENYILKNYPSVKICGKYREPSAESETLDPAYLNSLKPDIVLVGRGCPKQELWISKNKGQVNAVMMGIGAAFSFYAGTLDQAPKWMQDRGLEWFFRLCKEPKRLFMRYFVTNTKFTLITFKYIVMAKLGRRTFLKVRTM